MSKKFCPETGPDGELCGVAYDVAHREHSNRGGAAWTTAKPHLPVQESPADWLWETLGIDPDRISRKEFGKYLSQYAHQQMVRLHYPVRHLIPFDRGYVLRPCTCCHCGEGAMCFHSDEQSCAWTGPGR